MTTPPPSPSTQPRKILIVEDEEDIRNVLKDLLETGLPRVQVTAVPSGNEALRLLPQLKPDVIVSDYKMPGMNGLEFLELSRASAPETPKVLMTAFPDLEVAVKAINEAHIENFFQKPLDAEQILAKLDRILSLQQYKRDKEYALNRGLEAIRERLAQVESERDGAR